MKKHYILIALTLAAASVLPTVATAQSVMLSQNFEGEDFPPEGWLTIDNDGDQRTWVGCSTSDVSQVPGSRKLAVSFARDPKNYTTVYPDQDNWLISPAFEVTNDAYVLEFKYAAQDQEQTERLEVLVSEDGTAVDDFTSFYTDSYISNEYEDDIIIQSFSRALSDYVGKTIRVAFRHKASGSYGLSVDNIFIYNKRGATKPTGFSVKADESGALKATLSWTNPAKTANGEDISDLSIVVYRDGAELTVLNGMTPGEAASWTDENGLAGNHTYSIASRTAEGTGEPLTAKKVYLGEDYPAAVKNPLAMAGDGVITLTWTAPTAGANKGQINLDNITYTILREVDGVESEVVSGIKETTWTDTSVPAEKVCVYSVIAVNSGGESPVEDRTAAVVFGNDVADLACFSTTERDNGLARLPIEMNSKYSVSQSIYFPSDLNFVAGDIKQLVYKVYRGTASSSDVPVRIYMHETTETAFGSKWLDTKDAVLVYEGTFKFAQGVRDVVFDLATPFEYKGGNLVITFIKTEAPNGSYADRFYSMATGVANRSYTCSVYDPIDINKLPSSNYPTVNDQMPSTRFVIAPKGIGSLSGTVTNAASGAKIAKASITAVGNEAITSISDEEGRYSFPYFPVTIKQVKVSAVGFDDAVVDVDVAEGAAVVKDVELTQQANYSLTGKITCRDTGLPAAGATVSLSGYAECSTTTNNNGAFTLEGVYSGRDYVLSVEYPLYDILSVDVNNESTSTVTIPDMTVERSLIAPFGVEAKVADDAASVEISWPDPLSRDVEIGWKSINDVSTQKDTGGDYSSTNYNVAHLFDADEIAAQKLVGTSVKAIKTFIKADKGEFAIRVWREDAEGNREVLSEQKIPADKISATGDWVTVEFDEPVEIKAGTAYLFGVNCKDASKYPMGTAAYANYKKNYNNIKWAENPDEYCYDGYDAWCIIAECGVPGTDLAIAKNDDAPAAAYNVYRRGASDGIWDKLTPSPIAEMTFTDGAWESLVSDVYTYAVSAVYANGESAMALAEPISRSNDIDAGVTAFVSPMKSVDVQTSANVIVTVTNFGEKPVTNIPVTLSVEGVEKATATLTGPLAKGESANLDLGHLDIDKKVYVLTAETKLDGDMVDANNALAFTLPNLDNIEMMGYRWDAYGYAGIMKVQTNVPEAADYMLELTPNDALIIAAERVQGKIYAYTATWYGASREFVTIDPQTWIVENAVENTDDYILDMAYDHKNGKMYGLYPVDYDVYLVTIDLVSGVATPVGNLGATIRTLACDLEGNLYGISSEGDFNVIDPSTAATTLVGATGVDKVSYLQSMGFDHKSGRLFWAHTSDNVNGDLYEVNPETGAATRLGGILKDGSDQSEIVGLHSAFDPDPALGVTEVSTDKTSGISVMADGKGNVVVNSADEAMLTVSDASGRTVLNVAVGAGKTIVPMNVVPGIYIINAVCDGGSQSLKVSVK